jgi:hypothetical protein
MCLPGGIVRAALSRACRRLRPAGEIRDGRNNSGFCTGRLPGTVSSLPELRPARNFAGDCFVRPGTSRVLKASGHGRAYSLPRQTFFGLPGLHRIQASWLFFRNLLVPYANQGTAEPWRDFVRDDRWQAYSRQKSHDPTSLPLSIIGKNNNSVGRTGDKHGP